MFQSTHHHGRSPALAALVATCLAIAAPAVVAAGQSSPAVPPEPMTLRMATPYCDDDLAMGVGSRYTPAVLEFVNQVEYRSGGQVDIEIVMQLGGPEFCGLADGEQQVVQGVIDGDADLAWAGTRVFDTFGVTTFQALHAPFLVDSYALQATILDSDLPAEMLAGLDPIGLEGLAVLGGGLRKPIGRETPLLGPDDYAEITFQIYRSDVQAATVTALGATPTDVVAGVRDAGLIAGEIDGHEHSLMTYVIRGNHDFAPYVTANVNFWPETVALIANPDTFAGLSAEQQAWLRDAAVAASADSVALYNRDSELLAVACEQGAIVAEATDEDLGALRAAVEPGYTELQTDPQTAALIDEVNALKATVNAEPLTIPEGCATDSTSAGVSSDPRLPDGTYTTEPVTEQRAADALRSRGIDEATIAAVFDAVGNYTEAGETMTFTLDLQAGRHVLREQSASGVVVGSNGTFELLDDDTVALGVFQFDYVFDGETLSLRAAASDEEVQAFCAASLDGCFGVVGFESAAFVKVE